MAGVGEARVPMNRGRRQSVPPALQVSVQFASVSCDLPGEAYCRDWIERTYSAYSADAGAGRDVALRIVDEDEGRALNRRYRNKDAATNVLSFPAAQAAEFGALDASEPVPLGDLVLCAPVVAREAAAQGKQPLHHWAHLLVHGTLHLLGYDHEDAVDAETMEGLEVRLLEAHGIGNPYRERNFV